MAISSRNTLLAALAFIAFQAQAVNVTVAYQTSAEPAKVGFAPIFPDICYHLTHYKPAAADIPV
ncbi:hypothetical protein ACI50M_09210, partial [Escherichia coli]